MEMLSPDRANMMDHPLIGGKFTVFVLCYGEYPELAKSCLGSILSTLPLERLDLRVGLNAACDATRAYVKSLPATKIYEDESNAGKYVIMRRMFHDPACPITTTHLVWFDDDTRIVKEAIWQRLAEAIAASHPYGARLYGLPMQHDLAEIARAGGEPTRWFRAATWWRGKDMYVGKGPQTAPNGTCIHFAVGWFWCMATEMIRAADIPDVRLVHNGGDIACSEAVRQAGGKLESLNVDKEYVWHPSGGRRGKAALAPWSPPVESYRKAAEQGYAAAQNYVGHLYNRGQVVDQDHAEAAKWYRKAADQGLAEAQFNLGVLYANGQGVRQDQAEAARWYRKASEAGDRNAQNNFGVVYAKGVGVPQDDVQAHLWFSLAALQGDANAAMNRDVVVARMTPSQIDQAQALAAAWKPTAGQ